MTTLPILTRLAPAARFLIACALPMAVATPSVRAEDVGELLGAWSGGGSIGFAGGASERIRCNAYNTGGGGELRLVIRCASTNYHIEIRSRLAKSGSALSGEWEERTYNATGSAQGRLEPGAVSLAISGGGFTGRMNVAYSKTQQTIRITAEGIEMRRVDVKLVRSD